MSEQIRTTSEARESSSSAPMRVRWPALDTRSMTRAGAACAVWLTASVGPAPVVSFPVTAQEGQTTPPTLEETRLVMGKWIETQQIISKERNDWQQAKEILVGRLDLVKREIAGLEEKIQQAQTAAAETSVKRDALLAQNAELEQVGAQLADFVARMEGEVRRLFPALPEPIQAKLQPLRQRIPEAEAPTKVTVAERFQNVLGILNELNKANTDIAINYEVHTLADGKPSEVKAIYVGLAQAYYVSSNGEAGIGRPSTDGWHWEAANAIAPEVLTTLEIVQQTQSPAFVPLPVKLQ